MAYTPDWEPLADALKRVMETGASEDDAKTDLCRAVADRKINVQVKVAASEYGMPRRLFFGGNVGVPPHLTPDNLDWGQSRPLAKWPIGPIPPEHYTWFGGWENRQLDLLELSTADVIKILCGGGDREKSSATARDESAAIKALASHLENNNQLTRTEAVKWCRKSGYKVSGRGFQSRVWPEARKKAGLEAKARAGRKSKSLR